MKNNIKATLAAAFTFFCLSAQANPQENKPVPPTCDTNLPTLLAQRIAAHKIPSAVLIEIFPSAGPEENPQIVRDVTKKTTDQASAVFEILFGCHKGNEELNALALKLKDQPATDEDKEKFQNLIKEEQIEDLKKIYTPAYFIDQGTRMLSLFSSINEPQWKRNAEVFQLAYAEKNLINAVNLFYGRLLASTVVKDMEAIFKLPPQDDDTILTLEQIVQQVIETELKEMAKRYKNPSWIQERAPA